MLDRSDPDVRRFERVARQRYAESRFMSEHGFTTMAVYLGGYVVECSLKALLISRTPQGRRAQRVSGFRGKYGHNLESLAAAVLSSGRRSVRSRKRTVGEYPFEFRRALSRVASWSTDLRYNPGQISEREAMTFLAATARILSWITGGL